MDVEGFRVWLSKEPFFRGFSKIYQQKTKKEEKRVGTEFNSDELRSH